MKMADEYLAQVTNVYRTREYIVFQEIGISDDPEAGTYLYSYDTYHRRTMQKDREYEKAFKDRAHIDGNRIPVSTYVREYVEEQLRICRKNAEMYCTCAHNRV